MSYTTYCSNKGKSVDRLQKVLYSRQPVEPPQIAALRQYAIDNHNIDISVYSSNRNYLVKVPNGAVAHRFRVETAEIVRICQLDKPLVIHIG